MKLVLVIALGERKTLIDFGVTRAKVKVTSTMNRHKICDYFSLRMITVEQIIRLY